MGRKNTGLVLMYCRLRITNACEETIADYEQSNKLFRISTLPISYAYSKNKPRCASFSVLNKYSKIHWCIFIPLGRCLSCSFRKTGYYSQPLITSTSAGTEVDVLSGFHCTAKDKNCSPASEVNDRFASNQNDISVKLQPLYESNTTYVRCFEVIYTRQQNAILQPA